MKCGTKLENYSQQQTKSITKDKNMILAVAAVLLVLLGVIVIAVNDRKNIAETQDAIKDYRTQKYIEEEAAKPSVSDLYIDPSWKSYKDGNYLYIEGSVTNTSTTKEISYYEIGVKYYNSSGKVIDTDYTNGVSLEPGDTQTFRIMHKYQYDMKDADVYVKEVN